MKSFFSAAMVLLASTGLVSAQTPLPIVNLGYEQHQAIDFNASSRTYNFSNIPFGQPSLGNLRFRAPVPAWEAANSTSINNGSIGAICPQANTLGNVVVNAFLPTFLANRVFNYTLAVDSTPSATDFVNSEQVDPRTSEDCLQLDVVVPEEIYNKTEPGYGAPVLVWLYGGGYTIGEKTGFGQFQPYGLFERAQAVSGEKFIFVAPNYRLGAFGWLPGADLQADGTANAALYDQRTALHWVQKYIHLFGGDSTRVTLMGESAGAGSIMHQIVAFHGQQKPPFAQAIVQSAAWLPLTSAYAQDVILNEFMDIANVTSVQALRNLSTEQLQYANALHVAGAKYGSNTYTPVVDGIFAPQFPGRALLTGQFDDSLRLLIGHNGAEGLGATQPNLTSNNALSSLLKQNFAGISSDIISEIEETLYSEVYDGSQGYTTVFERSALIVSDFGFNCNTYYLDKAFGNKTYSYKFNVAPALHGQDVTYSFAWNDSAQASPNVATALQEYITSFVITGSPNSGRPLPGVPKIPMYGKNNTVTVLNTNITYVKDDLAGARCDFWQKALYA